MKLHSFIEKGCIQAKSGIKPQGCAAVVMALNYRWMVYFIHPLLQNVMIACDKDSPPCNLPKSHGVKLVLTFSHHGQLHNFPARSVAETTVDGPLFKMKRKTCVLSPDCLIRTKGFGWWEKIYFQLGPLFGPEKYHSPTINKVEGSCVNLGYVFIEQ